MKRLAIVFMCLVVAPMASASSDLAQSWAAKAGDLYLQTTAQMQANTAPLSDDYVTELERFAYTASQLAVWNDKDGGAKDLGCIFRGIAEDVEVQLDLLIQAPTAREQQNALKRLTALLDDAQQIGPAAAAAAERGSSNAEAPAACPANPYLKIGN